VIAVVKYFHQSREELQKMCVEMNVPLLTQVPLEPKLLLSCEGGKSFVKEFPESVTAKKFNEIVKKVK
jgi:nitrogenase subunit NifH